MTHSGMSSSHLCVRVFLCICLHDTKTAFHSRTRHSGVSSFQKLCSLEKVARAYMIWCENQVRTPYRLSHLILSCECSTNFTLEWNSWINCGMKVIPVSFQWPLSATLSNISFFFLFCSNAYLSARRVKHFIRDQIEASSPPFNNIITTAK